MESRFDSYRLDNRITGDFATDGQLNRRHRARPGLIFEGENDVFSQTWWPLCRSSDLPAGAVIGRNFLDGRVAIFRAEDDKPSVVSAYCPHNGADLSVGRVEDGALVCAFHEWRFNGAGRCIRTGSGDKITSGMRTFHYPTQERFGLIWAFNGETPLFDLPDLGMPDSELVFHTEIPIIDLAADPWIFMCNTSDFNHIKCVHKVDFEHDDPASELKFHEFGYNYRLRGKFRETGDQVEYDLGITGTNIFTQWGEADGKWFAFMHACGLHRPGMHRGYVVIATRKSDGTPADDKRASETLDFALDLEKMIVSQDADILNTIRFTRGMFTRSDRGIAMFLDYLKTYPRAHPGAEYIR